MPSKGLLQNTGILLHMVKQTVVYAICCRKFLFCSSPFLLNSQMPRCSRQGMEENKIGRKKNMRLDKYLKVSRLIKRRTVANEACDAGRVSVNGKVAKASQDVKAGDVIEIGFGTKNVKVEVLAVQDTSKKEEAKELFKYL